MSVGWVPSQSPSMWTRWGIKELTKLVYCITWDKFSLIPTVNTSVGLVSTYFRTSWYWFGTLNFFDSSLVPVLAILNFLYLPRTGITASPPVLSMWLQTVKFIAKNSKCASLAQNVLLVSPHQRRAACLGLYKVKHSCAPPNISVINWTWLRLSISNWSIITIGPDGLLLVVPHAYVVPGLALLVGLPKK
jgi:hypothetical protein